jgi:hypothetical protein
MVREHNDGDCEGNVCRWRFKENYGPEILYIET